MEFSDKCMEKLNESKQKVEKLNKTGDKSYSTEPFTVQNKEEEEKT
jgi:exonuclease VII small subunit